MRGTELLRLVWLNINQNKFKSIMTSIGIVVGAATIVMVIGIGRGGQMDIAEQFAELNAGAIDVSYEYEGEETDSSADGFSFGGIGNFFGNMFGGMFGGGDQGGGSTDQGSSMQAGGGQMPGGDFSGGDSNFSGGQMPGGGFPGGGDFQPGDDEQSDDGNEGDIPDMPEGETEGMPGEESSESQETSDAADEEETESETSMVDDRLNQEQIILTEEDVEDIKTYVTGISGATISYSTKSTVEGGNLTSEQTYTITGVKESFQDVSKLELAEGYFIDEADDETRSRVCVLGATTAKEIFGSVSEAVGSDLYIEDRCYTVIGVLSASSTVTSGITPDVSIFVPYETGIKYITGTSIDPTLTVIAEDVNTLQSVIANVKTVLEENYPNASFTFADSGSKMKAAEASNQTLTMLLSAMAAIVFLVGGIGIMNVLFVSVKERTNEIGILKAIGTPQSNILLEFLTESAAISLLGGLIGVALSFGVTPLVRHFDVRVEVNAAACFAALGFAVLTGTVFGLYPAWKASKLEPVEALTAE